MTRLKAIATLMLACAGLALTMRARADINEMQLGASISKDGKTVNFRVYSHNATHIELCLFASPQRRERGPDPRHCRAGRQRRLVCADPYQRPDQRRHIDRLLRLSRLGAELDL